MTTPTSKSYDQRVSALAQMARDLSTTPTVSDEAARALLACRDAMARMSTALVTANEGLASFRRAADTEVSS